MILSSACHLWQPDTAANAAQEHRSYTTRWDTIEHIRKVFDMTDFNVRSLLGIVAFDRRRVGAALVDRDLLGRTMMAVGLAQEAQRSPTIPLSSREEIYRGASLIDSSIQVLPGAL
jgi:hypothetical protein